MAARLSIFQKGLILILSPILLESLVVLKLSSVLADIDRHQLQESARRNVESSVTKMSTMTFESCMLLFALGMPGSSMSPSIFFSRINELKEQTDKVEVLFSSDASCRPIFKDIIDVEYKTIDLLKDLGSTISHGGSAGLLAQVQDTIEQIGAMLTASNTNIENFVTINQRRLAESSLRLSGLRKDYAVTLVIAFAGSILLAGTLLYYFYKSIIERILQVKRNTECLKTGQPMPASMDGSDEIALLDRAFHHTQDSLAETRRKESRFFENAADVICVLDRDYRFKKVNAAAYEQWGVLPEFLRSEAIETIVPEDDRELLKSKFDECCGGKGAATFECRVKKQDGGISDFAWSAYFEPEEQLTYCIVHDISGEKALERAREKYIDIVSHDLKEPISSIASAYSQVQSIQGIPEKANGKILSVNANLSRLSGLVRELSQKKSFKTESAELQLVDCDLLSLIKRAADELEGVAGKRGIKILVSAPELRLQIDAGRILQVILNLLSNAIKFSPDSSEVTVRVQEHDGTVLVEVEDKGRGVPEAQREKIFEKFAQVEQSDGVRAGGTGLGLPISKQIIEMHGGQIGVESEAGKGSCFWMKLPRYPAPRTLIDPEPVADKTDTFQSVTLKTDSASDSIKRIEPFLSSISIMKKGILLIGIPLVFQIIFVSALSFLFFQSEKLTENEIFERRVSTLSNRIMFCYRNMAILMFNPDLKSDSTRIFAKNMRETKELSGQLKTLLQSDSKRRNSLAQLDAQIERANKTLLNSFRQSLYNTRSSPYFLVGVTLRVIKPLGVLPQTLQSIVNDSKRLDALNPSKQKYLRSQQNGLLMGGLGINIVIGVWFAGLFSRDLRKRLEQIAENTRRLAAEKKLGPIVEGRDEIASLDRAFHDAADELLRLRKRERTLLDSSKEVICSIKPDGGITGINQAAVRGWGYSREKLLSSNLLDFVLTEDRERSCRFIENCRPGTPVSFENRVERADGSCCYMQWSVTRDESEQELFCVAHDVSDRKESEQLRNEFLSVISHELRTPLAGILITTTMLEEGGYGQLPLEAVSILSSVTHDVNRLLELINDLLDIEKLEAGMMTFRFESVRLLELVDELSAKTKGLLQRKQIRLNVEAADAQVLADKARIAQALANLLCNAIARSSDGAQIDLIASNESGAVSLVIRDHAGSVDGKLSEQIFDRFSFDGEIPATPVGSRLSVPLSKSIVTKHGGTVNLNALPAGGNEFVLSLPPA